MNFQKWELFSGSPGISCVAESKAQSDLAPYRIEVKETLSFRDHTVKALSSLLVLIQMNQYIRPRRKQAKMERQRFVVFSSENFHGNASKTSYKSVEFSRQAGFYKMIYNSAVHHHSISMRTFSHKQAFSLV